MENRHRPKIVALRAPADFGSAGNVRKGSKAAKRWEHESDPLLDPRWPAGWWILPFSIGGLIETTLLILWLTGHL